MEMLVPHQDVVDGPQQQDVVEGPQQQDIVEGPQPMEGEFFLWPFGVFLDIAPFDVVPSSGFFWLYIVFAVSFSCFLQ